MEPRAPALLARQRPCWQGRSRWVDPALLPLFVVLLGACGRGAAGRGSSEDRPRASAAPSTPSGPSASTASPAPPADAAALARPSRRYYLASSAERCFIYWEQGDYRSDEQAVPCPRELSGGERIRVSDRVCFLESGPASRDRPVRCPATLVEVEMADRHDAGLPP